MICSYSPLTRFCFQLIAAMSLPSFLKRNANRPDDPQTSSTGEKLSRMKESVKMAFANLKYGWMIHPDVKFQRNSPIWLLGRLYHSNSPGDPSESPRWYEEAEEPEDFNNLQDFLSDFTSRLWFTYRSGFEALPPGSIQSDAGWGCMLRSGQMFLAEGLLMHMLGRDWNMFAPQSPIEVRLHQKIISWFADCPEAPFSIHNMVETGKVMGKQSGDWFGPSSTAQIMRRLVTNAAVTNVFAELSYLAVYVALDQTIALDEIELLCGGPSSSSDVANVAPEVAERQSVDECVEVSASMNFDHWNHFESELPRKSSSEPSQLPIDDSGDNSASTSKVVRQQSDIDSWAVVDCNVDEAELRHSTPTRRSERTSVSIGNDTTVRRTNSDRTEIGRAQTSTSTGWHKSLLIMVPLRLGGESTNPIYVDSVKTLFSLDYFLGIMGGKQKRSVFFVGWHGDNLIYLDPHFCQDSVLPNGTDSLKTYHCMHPRLLSFSKMDPSCTIGFYIKNRKQFEQFCKDVQPITDEGNTKAHLFSIVKSKELFVGGTERRKESREAPNSFVFL